MRSIFALAALQLVSAAPALQDKTKYIVVLKEQTDVASLMKRSSLFASLSPFYTYKHSYFNGFAAALSANQLQSLTTVNY